MFLPCMFKSIFTTSLSHDEGMNPAPNGSGRDNTTSDLITA